MAWNEPGKGDKDPWGGRGKDSPPDLDDVLRNLQNKLSGFFGGSDSSSGNRGRGADNEGGGLGLGLIFTVVLLVWLATGIYIIEPAERGVILQFGQYKETVLPGPHWHLPFPIEAVEVVDVDKSRTVAVGFRSNATGSNTVASEALMLTKDENIIENEGGNSISS